MDNIAKQQHKSCEHNAVDSNLIVLSDNEWTIEATTDELVYNLATAEQMVTNKTGQTLIIRKYQSQCRKLARYIPISSPEYRIYSSDLKPEVRRALEEIHPELSRQVLHQAVLRLFEAVGIEPYISIGRKLIVQLIED